MKNNQSKRVLICEDDEGILDVVKIVLEENDLAVTVLTDPVDLESVTVKNNPDLILIDLWMPGMNGDEAIRKLKKNKQICNIPILIMSANKDIEQIAKDCGAEGCIAKPFDILKLEEMVVSILNK